MFIFFSKAVGGSKTITLSVPAITLQIVLDFLYTGQAGRIQGNGEQCVFTISSPALIVVVISAAMLGKTKISHGMS